MMNIKKEIKPFQSTFKVNTTQSKPTPRFVPRKAHTKSRGGCQSCKQRRVRCDEAKPTCGKCFKSKSDCHYPNIPQALSCPPNQLSAVEIGHIQVLNAHMHSMAVDLCETDLRSLMFGEATVLDLEYTDTSRSNARMLQHFQNVAASTLGCSGTQHAMQTYVGSNAWNHQYLMHMVLAISCAHQRKQSGLEKAPSIAEAMHWERGLRLHRQNLATLKPGQSKRSWDAVVATTFLIIMYNFTLNDDLPSDSLLSSDEAFEHALAPMKAIGGVSSLFYLFPTDDLDARSTWGSIMLGTDDEQKRFTSEEPGIRGLPRAFVDVFELDENSTVDNTPYHRVVRGLTPLLYLPPSHENFATLFAFLGRGWRDLKSMVPRKDPRSLLLLAYWFSLLSQIDQWWVRKRAQTECNALVAYLVSLHDAKINALLPVPIASGLGDTKEMWRMIQVLADDAVS